MGGQNCSCVAFLFGKRRKHTNKIPRKSQENDGTVPGECRHNRRTSPRKCLLCVSLGQKSCRTKVPRIFRISVPRILPRILLRIFPEFFEDFSCLRFVGDGDQKKFTKIPAIFQCKIPRRTRKKYSQNSSGEQQSNVSLFIVFFRPQFFLESIHVFLSRVHQQTVSGKHPLTAFSRHLLDIV